MANNNLQARRICAALAIAFSCAFSAPSPGAEIVFDLPESVECRDVTPADFAAAEYLKVIEGKLRISARVVHGAESEIVDFMYTILSPAGHVRFQDYLPNTTLESAVADDQVEIKDATERASTAGADVHVAYKLLGLGGVLNHSSKNSESSHYRQIAPKELVVASGTTDREHGVFFRLRPSRAASLEGAKEFSFLATVPKTWRGDLCTISCAARANKDSLWSRELVSAGARSAEVGMYLAGDVEAASLAEQLRLAQETRAKLAAGPSPKPNVLDAISCQTVGLLSPKKKPDPAAAENVAKAERALADAEARLKQLAR
jgi:hypothetical protein